MILKKIMKFVRIINTYEQYYKEIFKNNLKFYEKKYENEKEIKGKSEIRINDEIIPFTYFYEFNKKGKYNIKYIFKKKYN